MIRLIEDVMKGTAQSAHRNRGSGQQSQSSMFGFLLFVSNGFKNMEKERQ